MAFRFPEPRGCGERVTVWIPAFLGRRAVNHVRAQEANLNREKKLMELQTDMNIGNNEKMELMKAIHNEDDFLEAKAAISGGAQMTPAPKQRADSGSKGKISPPTTKSNRGQKQQRSSARTVGGKVTS